MSSIIAKSHTLTNSSDRSKDRTTTTTTTKKRSLDSSMSDRITPKSIDLTGDDDDMFPMTPEPYSINNSQPYSVNSSQSSWSSQRERPQNEEMTNTSKYNKKAWSVKAKEQGPTPSDQSHLASQEKVVQRYERIVLKKSRITAKPTYDWLGPNDVKPFSSNINTNMSSSSTLNIRKPDISFQYYSASYEKKDTMYASSEWDSQNTSSQISLPTSWRGDHIPKNTLGPSKSNSKGYGSQQKKSWNSPSSSQDTSDNTYWDTDDRMNSRKMSSFGSNKYTANKEYSPELSDEQQRILDMVVNQRKSLFFTGSAGTGKSVLLRAIIDQLSMKYGNQLAVTASTGIAACNINGCTLHSFGGIGIGSDSAQQLSENIKVKSRKAKDRWLTTRVLVIDEISMVDADLFDKLDFIARDIRQNGLPFGGMQIIVTGDFFQLPPVNPNAVSKFAFEAKCWPLAIKQTVMLTKVFRQKDGTFIRILNEMRLGHLSEEAIQKFKSLSRVPQNGDEIEPTELYPLRNEVDISNKRRLDALSGEVVEFTAIDSGDVRKMQSCIAPHTIQLKLYAQVMLLKNIDIDLVNGSIGVVVGFVGKGKYAKKKAVERLRTPYRQKDSVMLDGEGEINMSIPFPVVKFSGGRIVVLERESWSVELPGGRESAKRDQIPLMLAWAISIHKSQGQTLDRVKVDLGKVFEKGQAYVALSRATSLDTLQILNFDPVRVMAHPTVTRFYRTLQTV